MGRAKGETARNKSRRPSSSSLAASLLPPGSTVVGFGGYVGGSRVDCSLTTSDAPPSMIQGGIGNELYSEIVQSSNVELDRGSKTNENLHGKESDSGDLWYEGSDIEREWQMRHNHFHTIGYRDGLIAGKEAAAQEGFNIGFKNSVFAGYNWGLVRGINSAMTCLPGALKEKLVKTEVARNKLNHLHETVQSLSTTDALKLFYEDQKRKSPNEKEIAKPSSTVAVSNHQMSEISVLENYHRRLESLISESPLLLEGHLKVN